MHRLFTLILLLLSSSFLNAKHHKSTEFKSIFNGKTLEGWTQKNGTATYVVKDGAILGTTNEGSPNSFLCSNKLYGNFELQFEVKLINDELNSGVQIRSQTKELNDKEKKRGDKFGRVNGPQVEIEATKGNGAESGYIYGEACGGWMTPKDELKPHKHFKNGEWNKYRSRRRPASKLGSTATKCPTSWTRKSSRPTPRDSLACKFMESGKDRGRTALPGATSRFAKFIPSKSRSPSRA